MSRSIGSWLKSSCGLSKRFTAFYAVVTHEAERLKFDPALSRSAGLRRDQRLRDERTDAPGVRPYLLHSWRLKFCAFCVFLQPVNFAWFAVSVFTLFRRDKECGMKNAD